MSSGISITQPDGQNEVSAHSASISFILNPKNRLIRVDVQAEHLP